MKNSDGQGHVSIEPRKKLILCIVDGLPAALLEAELSAGTVPNFAMLAEHAEYRRGTSVFPSVTPVCLSAIATGETVDEHGIPHIAWFDRDEGRVVDYGSSTRAVLGAGPMRVWRDSMVEMTRSHLSRDVDTIFESLERKQLVTATVSFTCFRGPVEHQIRFPRFLRRGRFFETVEGPSKFFFFNLFLSGTLQLSIGKSGAHTARVAFAGCGLGRRVRCRRRVVPRRHRCFRLLPLLPPGPRLLGASERR